MARYSCKHIFVQSAPVLSLTVFLSIASGTLIEQSLATIMRFPILLVLLPAFIDACGDISTVFASKVTSAFYFHGELLLKKKRQLFSTAQIIMLCGMVFFVFLGFAAFGLESVVGGRLPDPLSLFASVILSALITITLGMLVAIMVAWRAYKRKLDPDNFEAPILSTFSDLVGVLVFLNVSRVLLGG